VLPGAGRPRRLRVRRGGLSAVLARPRRARLRRPLERPDGAWASGGAACGDLRLSERRDRLLARAGDAALRRAPDRPRGRAGVPAALAREPRAAPRHGERFLPRPWAARPASGDRAFATDRRGAWAR